MFAFPLLVIVLALHLLLHASALPEPGCTLPSWEGIAYRQPAGIVGFLGLCQHGKREVKEEKVREPWAGNQEHTQLRHIAPQAS